METSAVPTDGTTPAFGPKLLDALEPVFEGAPLFVSDSRQVISWLLDEGCLALAFDHLDDVPPADLQRVALIPTSFENLPSYDRWHELFSESRVLILPFVSFDPSLPAIRYTLGKLAETSVTAAVENNTTTLSDLIDGANPFDIRGEGFQLRCELEDDVTVLRPKIECELAPGEWESIGAYFEVGLVPTPEDFKTGIRPGYVVDGELEVPGVAVACHRHVNDEIRTMARDAWALLQDVRAQGGFPLRLTVENSRVRTVMADSGDISPRLRQLTNPNLDSVLTEMSFSTNSALLPETVDWSVNSQMNEGASGIHVALGDGVTGAHIDFICPGAERVVS